MNAPNDIDAVTLWGPISSFYSGKTRAYLVKKGIPFDVLYPSHPRYMAEIVPRIGHFALPVVEFPDGRLLQDSTETILYFEQHANGPAMIPAAPVQRTLAWLLGCLGSECMWKLGLHYRWTYLEEQRRFIEEDAFGRPASSARDLDGRRADAAPLMAQFSGKLDELGVTRATIPGIEAAYDDLLERLNAHFYQYPYLMGGRPSLADFGFIAPFFAHLARDPYPSNHMKNHAPNVYRWTERMFEHGLVDPEFPDLPSEWLADDAIPPTTLSVLENLFTEFGTELGAMIDSYNAWCDANAGAAAGTLIQDPEEPGTTHPSLGWIEFQARGVMHRRRDSVDTVHHLQRVFDVVDALSARERKYFEALVDEAGGTALMTRRPTRRIEYQTFRYTLG